MADSHLLAAIFVFAFITITTSTFTPNTTYFLNCGANSSANLSSDNPPRVFSPDSIYLPSLSNSTSLSTKVIKASPNSAALYATARLFTGAFTYRLRLNSSGSHVIRLHFFAFTAETYNLAAATFNVSALNRFILLANFSVSANNSPVIKEYFLWVDDGQQLELTFSPTGNKSPFAFINAIEVFTAPSAIMNDKNDKTSIINQLNHQAVETVLRLNVGGQLVTPQNDTLWRTWSPDDEFLLIHSAASTVNVSASQVRYREDEGYTEEVAPRSIYDSAKTMNVTEYDKIVGNLDFNVTWTFAVEVGYSYLVRLHFCDLISESYDDTIYFDIYVGDQKSLDEQSQRYTDNLTEAFYLDFGVIAPSNGLLAVSIGKSDKETDVQTANAYLNGLEIFKVNNSDGSLNSTLVPSHSPNHKKNIVAIVASAAASAVVIALIILIVCLVMCKKKPLPKTPRETSWAPFHGAGNSSVTINSDGSTRPSVSPANNFGLQIPLLTIRAATNDFNSNLVIGTGGFGKVYKGVFSDGTRVAVKRASARSQQGYPAFKTEITLLSQVRHKHLVSLIGYCEEQGENILVYEFMEKGSLRDYLYGSPDKPCLSWKQRLEICINAARGLHYLHTGFTHTIIHRDVKSTNILLDGNYVAKVSDFGLSKIRSSEGDTTVTTDIKGTFGYMDPQYVRTRNLTVKSDVYSFGVVLFEVLCARPVIQHGVTEEQISLTEWALLWQRRNQLEKIVDQRLEGGINVNSLRKFGETAEKCLADYGDDRPTFGDVLWNLEYALQLQQTQLRRELHEDSQVSASRSSVPDVESHLLSKVITIDENENEGSDASPIHAVVSREVEMTRSGLEHSTVTASSVFSQLIAGEGR